MLEFLDKLRERSEEERRTVAFVGALILTFLIAFIWLSILMLQPSPKEEVRNETPGPLESSKNIIDSGLKSVSDLFN